jgi:hypothetical protein
MMKKETDALYSFNIGEPQELERVNTKGWGSRVIQGHVGNVIVRENPTCDKG